MSGMLYSIPVILTGYRIVQIEDEATPLAQAAKSGYYGDTVAGMLGIGVLLLLVIYFILCRKYQKRIIELQENAHDVCRECYNHVCGRFRDLCHKHRKEKEGNL